MRFRVELHRDVERFLKERQRKRDYETVSAFYERLDEVREDPVGCSEAVSDPDLSRYMLRYFRFAGYIALFQIDLAKDRVVIRSCRKHQPGHPSDQTGQ